MSSQEARSVKCFVRRWLPFSVFVPLVVAYPLWSALLKLRPMLLKVLVVQLRLDQDELVRQRSVLLVVVLRLELGVVVLHHWDLPVVVVIVNLGLVAVVAIVHSVLIVVVVAVRSVAFVEEEVVLATKKLSLKDQRHDNGKTVATGLILQNA